MNYQFMFNGRQDFEQNFLIQTLILTWLGWGGGGGDFLCFYIYLTIKNDFLVASTEILFLPFLKNNNYDYNQFFFFQDPFKVYQ